MLLIARLIELLLSLGAAVGFATVKSSAVGEDSMTSIRSSLCGCQGASSCFGRARSSLWRILGWSYSIRCIESTEIFLGGEAGTNGKPEVSGNVDEVALDGDCRGESLRIGRLTWASSGEPALMGTAGHAGSGGTSRCWVEDIMSVKVDLPECGVVGTSANGLNSASLSPRKRAADKIVSEGCISRSKHVHDSPGAQERPSYRKSSGISVCLVHRASTELWAWHRRGAVLEVRAREQTLARGRARSERRNNGGRREGRVRVW